VRKARTRRGRFIRADTKCSQPNTPRFGAVWKQCQERLRTSLSVKGRYCGARHVSTLGGAEPMIRKPEVFCWDAALVYEIAGKGWEPEVSLRAEGVLEVGVAGLPLLPGDVPVT